MEEIGNHDLQIWKDTEPGGGSRGQAWSKELSDSSGHLQLVTDKGEIQTSHLWHLNQSIHLTAT